ncbi:uncharacterized protein LOC141629484 [Silene latifolia]|uniref:uncharacterized protein LOC141629484 n=1 Tax=Silene latifolia TaxID=37657 RepID=UPI003D771032
MGGKIDHYVNQGRGPYTFRMRGQNIHQIGSLLPSTETTPKFCQFYIYDIEEEVENRKKAISHDTPERFNDELIELLQKMVDSHNVVAKTFRVARDRLYSDENVEVSIRLLYRSDRDGRTCSHPTVSEVAALIESDLGLNMDKRDIIVQKSCGSLQCISAPVIHSPPDRPLSVEFPTLLQSGKAYHQFLVDGFASVESHRLKFIRFKQDPLRVDNYNNLRRVVEQGDIESSSPEVLLLFLLLWWFDYPDLFITFTCNPKWTEITRFVSKRGLNPEDRPDILSRVFKIKLEELMIDLKQRHIFGRARAGAQFFIYQKRGLPHAHILLFLRREDKFPEAADIDKIISVEIPDPVKNPVLHVVVEEIKRYYDCRYLSPCEVVWRIFAFDIHYRTPAVERLQFHLPGEQSVVFDDEYPIDEVLEKS